MRATTTGILAVKRLCEEAIDHEMGWESFAEMIRHKLDTETQFIELAKEDE